MAHEAEEDAFADRRCEDLFLSRPLERVDSQAPVLLSLSP